MLRRTLGSGRNPSKEGFRKASAEWAERCVSLLNLTALRIYVERIEEFGMRNHVGPRSPYSESAWILRRKLWIHSAE